MKHLLILLALIIICTPVSAQGLSLTFQNPADFVEFVTCVGTFGNCAYTQSNNGGNSYVTLVANAVAGPLDSYAWIVNTDPLATTYAAGTVLTTGGDVSIRLYDSGFAPLYTYSASSGAGRYEVVMSGASAQIKKDGILLASSPALAQNPSYIGFGAHNFNAFVANTVTWDMIVYGTAENKNIFGGPENGYFIKKNMLNPAIAGFCFPNGTIVSSFNMSSQWGFGNDNSSRTVIFQNYGTGQTYSSVVTTPGTMSGSTAWPIYDAIIASGAPYGYYVTTVSGSGAFSELVEYRAEGATVTFNQASYSRGNTAAITHAIDAGGYFNPAVYSYRLDILDVYLNVIDSTPVTTQNGITTYTFTSTDALGVYYAALYATPLAGGSDILMASDVTELTGFLVLTGYPNDAETQLPLNGAVVNISQGNTVYNHTTEADGNYTTNVAFYSGASTIINVTKSGYRNYTKTFTPLEAKTITLNFTLVPVTPTFTGIAIGGVCRDTTYGRPVSSCNVAISNATYGESYAVTANSVGYYLLDEPTVLTSGRAYTVFGSKSGYSVSVNYTVVA